MILRAEALLFWKKSSDESKIYWWMDKSQGLSESWTSQVDIITKSVEKSF